MDFYAIKPYIYWGGVCIFLLAEQGFSYREPTVGRARRWLANLPLSVMNGAIYHLLYTSAIVAMILAGQEKNIGLLNVWILPEWFKIVAGILILDFSIYLWHLLTHALPFLWRFHRVHHSDLNMDVTTGNRFHLGEFLFTGLIRLAVVYTFGIGLTAYILFEIFVNLSVQFHHSSIKVAPWFERLWALLFVPPFLHRIHHSVKIRERDSNYGVTFSIWDRMLGTLTTGVVQEGIVIGIGSHREIGQLGFWRLLVLPFTRNTP
ncbi:MAG: sterol desaturase family protein [Desulfobulbaceae bacterium]|nr:sterol desaturase family protein [Desulfobulbaceae bacterium]HIJ89640.1 sterol desaturase family protein [Deltaproteobacteria bacterium]